MSSHLASILASAQKQQLVKNPKKNRIVIVDGANNFIRNFAVNDSMTLSGDPCGGVVGFIRFLGNYVEQWSPDQVIVVWEQGGGSPRRKRLFPDYKANRTKITEIKQVETGLATSSGDLPSKKWIREDKENKLEQLLTLTECLKLLPVCQIYVSDCECDDIVGYLVREYYSHHRDLIDTITVVSTDRDFYQLLTYPEVRVWDPMKKRLIDAQFVLDNYGISPENFVLGKAIVGDPSDNIPGVGGVGWKTLTARFGDLLRTREVLSVHDVLQESNRVLSAIAQAGKTKKGKGKKGVLSESPGVEQKLPPPAVYQKVLESEQLLNRNVRLMELESSVTLAPTQVHKVLYQVQNYEPNIDKMGLIKQLLSKGIVTTIDYDRAHMAWKVLYLRARELNANSLLANTSETLARKE